jgi:hypothetical protein
MHSDKIRVTFVDFTGTHHADVSLSSRLTVKECHDRLMRAGFIDASFVENDRIQVAFINPSGTQRLEAAVRTTLTAAECIGQLIKIKFLPESEGNCSYRLQLDRTGETIHLNETLEQTKAVVGDVFTVVVLPEG